MNHHIRMLAAIGIVAAVLLGSPTAFAGPNAAIDALENTPVSVLTYTLSGLDSSVNAYLGRGGKPSPSAMFTAPLSGPIADFATTLFDQDDDTITLNLIHIADLGDGVPDEACKQAFAAMHLFASLDPATGKLQGDMTELTLAASFIPDGTPAKPPANDLQAIDKAFRLRFNGTANGKRFVCAAPLFGSDYKLTLK